MNVRKLGPWIGLLGVAVGLGLVLGGALGVGVVPWLLLAVSRVLRWWP